MTILHGVFSDVAYRPLVGKVTVHAADLRQSHGDPHRLVTCASYSADLEDGAFTSPQLDPGPVVVSLSGDGVERTWHLTLPEEGTVELSDLVDAQVEYTPQVVSRVQEATRRAEEATRRAEEAAQRAEEARQGAEAAKTQGVGTPAPAGTSGLARGECTLPVIDYSDYLLELSTPQAAALYTVYEHTARDMEATRQWLRTEVGNVVGASGITVEVPEAFWTVAKTALTTPGGAIAATLARVLLNNINKEGK